MWICPKCKRKFAELTPDHVCDSRATPIDDYIAAQHDTIQHYLSGIRDTIREVLPDAEERIAWKMPTFRLEHDIIHFAAHKNHIGLYPGPEAIMHFSERLKAFKTSKGAVQFPYSVPLPLDLIGEIATWCYETGLRH